MGNVAQNDIPDWLRNLAPELAGRIERFLSAAMEVGVRVEHSPRPWQLWWEGPTGDIQLGYLQRCGKFAGRVWTDQVGAANGSANIDPCVQRYQKHLAELWGGKVKCAKRTWVADSTGRVFRIQDLDDQQFDDWVEAIEAFQQDVQTHCCSE